ncbi:hypothetical protein MVEN_00468300 [Mycena venus]|uniref:Uncharacterized protein n=1 Tax=Mycena venus TaxID=2733690 RepID=A0A8H6YX51_9AGAR|nr:hypothetical protein MVEN_00468300 [Mycena venus]
MDVSLEAYRIIVRSVARRSDIAALCGVNRAFRNAAERALYNTLTVSDQDPRLCATLTASPRIASLVIALTVQVRRRHDDEDEDEEEASESDDGSGVPQRSAADSSERNSRSSMSGGASDSQKLDAYWSSVAGALRNAARLRHLTIDIADPADSANAWVLDGCVFQLRTFHCDFDWDHALLAFLATQTELHDLSLRDYREIEENPDAAAPIGDDVPPAATDNQNAAQTDKLHALHAPTTEPTRHTLEQLIPLDTNDTTTSQPTPSLPALATLECTFSEAAVALVPARPISRLKTCFSRSDPAGKRAELIALLGALRLSAVPLRALDIADASYTESGAMELLHRVVHTQAASRELRYLGTLVLPIGGRKRLHFYGLLMRLRLLRCIEVDVSAWKPPPSSSPAFRALAAELRLYCPDVDTVVFVHEFERTVVSTGDTGVLRIDEDASPELFWREI